MPDIYLIVQGIKDNYGETYVPMYLVTDAQRDRYLSLNTTNMGPNLVFKRRIRLKEWNSLGEFASLVTDVVSFMKNRFDEKSLSRLIDDFLIKNS